ncbi:DUF1850 domain-containing protein [Oceanobacillus massiliensis]|uniref:DUF1850 domain-containing protein n=1 Tax=Oceanobacillus massiliensis TaxID=1465765 RepID=UPI00028A33DB|nr:DUF1850 domain-containing protein [Oceanobacillus massiliensis]
MNSKWIVWSTCVSVLLFSLFFRLQVVQLDFGHATYYIDTKRFELHWIHSVEREEWAEIYRLDKGELILTETYFKTFGAGVPSGAEVIASDDSFIHMKINQRLSEMNLTVSENVMTTIITDQSEIPLYKLTDDYETVNISVASLHIWDYIGGEFL